MVNSSILIADAKIVFILQVYPRKVLKITNRMLKKITQLYAPVPAGSLPVGLLSPDILIQVRYFITDLSAFSYSFC